YPKHWSWIDSFPQSFVIKADIAASDGDFQFLAGFGDAVNHLRKLPHDVRLLGIAEIQAIGRSHRSRARTRDIPRRFSDCMHAAQFRIEIAPAPVAIKRHGQSTLGTFNSNYSAVAGSGSFDCVGLHHGVVLLIDPTLTADVLACQHALQVTR